MRHFILVILALSALVLFCSPPGCGFTSNNQYSRESFSGRDLGDRTIGMCPFLGIDGIDTSGSLKPYRQLINAKKLRRDLKFTSVEGVENKIIGKLGLESLKIFYDKLSKSDMIALQTSDSVWNAIECDYYLVNRLKSGISIKSFDGASRKRLELETELWDCRTKEPVWRQSVSGICSGSDVHDAEFLNQAISRILEEIPKVKPAYDNRNW
jgi:hypothetical protein